MARREKLLRDTDCARVFENVPRSIVPPLLFFIPFLFFFPPPPPLFYTSNDLVKRFWNREFSLPPSRLRGEDAQRPISTHRFTETWTRTSYCTPLGDDCGPTNSRSNWWNRGEPLVVPSPTLCLTPTDCYCSSLRRILFLFSLLGGNPGGPVSVPGCLAGGRLWEKRKGSGREGVDGTRDLLIGTPDLIRKPAGEISS